MTCLGPSKTCIIYTIGDDSLPGEGGDTTLVMLNNLGTAHARVCALYMTRGYC
jgi:hypothetical protein